MNWRLVDTHAHLNFSDYDQDRGEIIKNTLDRGVGTINASVNYNSSEKAIEISEQYQQGVYAAIGLHPLNIKQDFSKTRYRGRPEDALEEDFNDTRYRKLAKSSKVVAVGEVGLDYWFKPKTKNRQVAFKAKQKSVLLKEIEFARNNNLPVIFHCRVAHQDLLGILSNLGRKSSAGDIRGVIHSFTGSWSEAQQYLDMGFYLGFSGIVFKLNLDDIIKKTPLDRILLETDSPFLAPPRLGVRRNEPKYVEYVAEKIAIVRNSSVAEISKRTSENARELFGI